MYCLSHVRRHSPLLILSNNQIKERNTGEVFTSLLSQLISKILVANNTQVESQTE